MRPSLYKIQIELLGLSATIQDVITFTFQIEVMNLLAEHLRKLRLKLLPGRSVCHVTSAGIYTFRSPEVTKPSMLLAPLLASSMACTAAWAYLVNQCEGMANFIESSIFILATTSHYDLFHTP